MAETNFPFEASEKQLAHAVGGKTVTAYARDHMLDKRRAMMTAWENYALPGSADTDNVIELRRAQRSWVAHST